MKLHPNLELDRCPHCGVSEPNLREQWKCQTENHSGTVQRKWKAYLCHKCGGMVIAAAKAGGDTVVEFYPYNIMETFDFEYLEGDVKDDFEEALICYSFNCFNAFAAMCRRTIQSIADYLGAEGKDRVKKQIEDLKNMINIDDETFDILEQITVAGHDGAHPHLPKLSPERAVVLLELMKDVINQLIIRKKKLEKSVELRKKAIEESKGN